MASETDGPGYQCPHHGAVEGLIPTDGPLANTVPTPILCEECDPFATTVVGYEEVPDGV